MKKTLLFLFSVSLLLAACEKNDKTDDGKPDSSSDRVTRIDVRSDWGDGEYFQSIFFFSYDNIGVINSFSILYPRGVSNKVDEGVFYSMDMSTSSLSLAVDYRMLLYDGVNEDYAIGVETEHDTADCFAVSDGRVTSVRESHGTFFYFLPLEYVYDEDGHLLSRSGGDDEYYTRTLVWKDDNMISITEGETSPGITEFNYTDYEAPAELGNFLTDFFVNVCEGISTPYVFYTGRPSRNLPSHASYKSYSDDVVSYSAEMSFSYDVSEGKVRSLQSVFDDGSDHVTYDFTFYYDVQDPESLEWVPVRQ